MFCPKCGSSRIRRSHTRSLKEKILKSFGLKAFRCREQGCDWRGLIRVATLDGIENGLFIKYRNSLLFVSAIIIFLLIIYLYQL